MELVSFCVVNHLGSIRKERSHPASAPLYDHTGHGCTPDIWKKQKSGHVSVAGRPAGNRSSHTWGV